MPCTNPLKIYLASSIGVTNVDISTLTGLASTVNGVAFSSANMILLLVAQTDKTQNGLWYSNAGAWIHYSFSAVATTANPIAVLITSGTYSNTTAYSFDADGPGFVSNWVYKIPDTTQNLIQMVTAKVTTDQTTSSPTLVDLTGASASITTQAGTNVLVSVSYCLSNSSALGSLNRIALVIDGVVEPGLTSGFSTPLISNSTQSGAIIGVKTGLSAGAHTFKLQWANSIGTTQCRPVTGAPNTEHASILLQEVRV